MSAINIYKHIHKHNNKQIMDRDIIVFNRPVMEKIQKKNHEMHRQRLKNIKSGLCNRTTLSQRQSFKLNTTKTWLLQEQKKTQISKQNCILLNKMSNIAKRSDQSYNKHSYCIRNYKSIEEKSRIQEQNKNMFMRLSHQRPTISNKKLFEDRSKNLSILKFLGKYPNSQTMHHESIEQYLKRNQYQDRRYHSTHQKRAPRQQEESQLGHRNKIQKDYKKRQPIQRRHKSQAINREQYEENVEQTVHNKSLHSSQIQNNKQGHTKTIQNQKIENSSPHRSSNILLYKGRTSMQGKPAIIYFYRSYDCYHIILQFDTPIFGVCEHSITLSEEEGSYIFTKNNYDYKEITKMLNFKDRILCLIQIEHKKQKKAKLSPKEQIDLPSEFQQISIQNNFTLPKRSSIPKK